MSRIVSIVLIVRNGSLEGRRTWPGEFVGKVLGEFVAGEVGDGSEEDDGPDEARVAQHDALVGRELAQRLRKHHVVPMILTNIKNPSFHHQLKQHLSKSLVINY